MIKDLEDRIATLEKAVSAQGINLVEFAAPESPAEPTPKSKPKAKEA